METIGQVIRVPNMRVGYVAIVKAVAEHGEYAAPRGQATREFQCATILCEDPFDTLPTGVGRGLVSGIAAVESAQLLAGESRPSLVMKIGPAFKNFAEDNGEFHGAYGLRTKGQFQELEKRLRLDPSSRQAVATIWNPAYDLLPEKRDYPCTVMYHFMIRDNKLIMEVVMRSNDVILGLGYDAFQHSRVQIAMASVLGIEPGEYRHHAMSLHLYERDLDMVDRLTMPQKTPDFFPHIVGTSWDDVVVNAKTVLDMAEDPDGRVVDIAKDKADSMQWYINSMLKAIEKNESE